MERNCDVIRDLLPLYADGCCREGSKALVEAHLTECAGCRTAFEEMTGQLPLAEEPPEPEAAPAEKVLKKGMKKVRRRWIASTLVTVLVVALAVPAVWLGLNERSGQGVCYSNLDDLWIAHCFMKALKQGDYERAYSYTYWEALGERWKEEGTFREETVANIEQDGLGFFLESTQLLKHLGGITDYRLLSVESGPFNTVTGAKSYYVNYKVTITGRPLVLTVAVRSSVGVFGITGQWWKEPPEWGEPSALLNEIDLWMRHLYEYYEEREAQA